MKIALSFPGCHRRGGVERIVLEAARFLDGRGHEVHVFANEWDAGDSTTVRFRHVPMWRFPGFLQPLSYQKNATRLIAAEPFDAIGTFGCECPFGGVHWAQSVHRAWLQRSQSMRPPWSAGRIRQQLNPLHPVLLRLERAHFGERNYRKVIVTTPEVKADLARLYNVPGADVGLVPNGFSPAEFNPATRQQRRAKMRSRLGLASDTMALLFVANELDRKGLTPLLGALRRLKRADVKLLVVGRPDVRQVRARAAAAGVEGQVIACGATSDVAGFHAAADLFVLPTQYEAFCLAILEALGSGLPVVTTDVPGARDAIQEGVNGLLVRDPLSDEELATALEVALNRQRREKMSAAAPATVGMYQWPVVLERYERLLTKR
jgi:UDP-glucose:(heptosyl)LPS alpha-1,3-glucosyltransferase